MDIPSKHVDDAIAYTLATDSVVSTTQKNRAWEKLQQQAAQQVILAPYAVAPRSVPPKQETFIELLLDWVRRGIGMLVTDEAMYQRAACRREILQRIPYATATTMGSQQMARFHMADILRYGLL